MQCFFQTFSNLASLASMSRRILNVLFYDLFCRENEHGWDEDIQNDVLEEISKLGAVVHIHVDSTDPEVS